MSDFFIPLSVPHLGGNKSRYVQDCIDNIRFPLLIAQGANDPRVPQKESDQMVDTAEERH